MNIIVIIFGNWVSWDTLQQGDYDYDFDYGYGFGYDYDYDYE